jgi:hypothetical protein
MGRQIISLDFRNPLPFYKFKISPSITLPLFRGYPMEKHLKMCPPGSKHCTVCPVRGLKYDPFKAQPLVSLGWKRQYPRLKGRGLPV